MKEVIEKCKQFYNAMEGLTKAKQKLVKDLEDNQKAIAQKQRELNEYEESLNDREKRLIPSEAVIQRELDCDKRERELQDVMCTVQLKAKNNTDAVTQARKHIKQIEEQLKYDRGLLEKERSKFLEEKKNWKMKLIEQIEKEKHEC